MVLIKRFEEVRAWASAISISALVFTIYQVRQSGLIADSMSTKYVGVFPENMPSIVDAIGAATSSICIVADAASYGHFSDPREFQKYRSAINEAVARGVEVTVTSYKEEAFREANREQLANITNTFEDFARSASFENYRRWVPGRADEMCKGAEQFFEGLIQNEQRVIREFGESGVSTQQTERHMPLYAWIADDRLAVFAFVVHEGDAGLEYSFETRDGHLIKGLRTLASGYRPNSSSSTDSNDDLDEITPHSAADGVHSTKSSPAGGLAIES
ncbi:MAG: hypothetical protein AAFU73_03480 [Planctomycetota bacterium]